MGVKRWLSPWVALLALVLIYFWRIVFEGEVLYWADNLTQFYPWHLFAAQSLRLGEIPLWNPYVFGGMPFLANLQSAVLYPLNLLFLVFPAGRALGYVSALHVFLTGAFMYAYLREVRLSRFAALGGAVSLMLGGWLMTKIQIQSIIAVFPWLPLALFLQQRFWNTGKLVYPGLLSLVVGVQFLGGQVQYSFMNLLLICAHGIMVPMTHLPQPLLGKEGSLAGRRLPYALWSVLALLVGVTLAAPQLFPAAELTHQAARVRMGFRYLTEFSLPPWQIATFLLPDLFGNPAHGNYWGEANLWETACYVGLIPFLAACLGVWSAPSRKRWFWLGIALVCLLLSFGHFAPFYRLFMERMPGFALFKAPSRFLYLVTFSIGVLAAMGLDAVSLGLKSGRTRMLDSACLLYCLLFGALLVLALFGEGTVLSWLQALLRFQMSRIGAQFRPEDLPGLARISHHQVVLDLIVGLLVSGFFLLLVRWRERSRISDGAFKSLALATLALDLLVYGMKLNPFTEARIYAHRPASVAYLQRDAPKYRVLTRHSVLTYAWGHHISFMRFGASDYGSLCDLVDSLTPNLPMAYGIRNAQGYDTLRPVAAMRYLQEAERELSTSRRHDSVLRLPLLSSFSVKHVLAMGEPFEHPLRRVDVSTIPRIWENREALPRVYVTSRVVTVPSFQEGLRAMQRDTFRPGAEVIITGGAPALARPVSTRHRASIARESANQLSVEVDCNGHGCLVVTDAFWPGWRAYVNGRTQRISPANALGRCVPVPPGRTVVHFVYLPTCFLSGVFAGMVALSLTAAVLAYALARRA